MNGVLRPQNILGITPELLEPFSAVLCDRDGVLADAGKPIDPAVEDHLNKLIGNTDASFRIVTNGSGTIGNINAELIRTWPRIKQWPDVLKNLVETPGESLLITDSYTETFMARKQGFNVYYISDKFKAHPAEEAFRKAMSPIKVLLSRFIQFELI